MEDLLNTAVIGAGYWGRKVIAEYAQLSKGANLGLPVVCDLDKDALIRCGKEFQIPQENLSTDLGKVLASGKIAAVHICTPNETHHKICKEALLDGKHVLLEKPMALNARDAWELVGMAEHSDRILQVGHIFRFNNALKLTRDLVSQNFFGKLYYLKLQWTTLASSPLGRDIIFDLGPHPIDILNYLLKRWPVRVTCKARAYRRKTLEELAYFCLEFDEDLLANVELSWLQPGKVRQLDIVGSERTATVDCLNQLVSVHDNGNGDAFRLDVVRNNTILDEVSHFVHSISDGENSHNPGSIGAQNTSILETLKGSLEANKTMETTIGG